MNGYRAVLISLVCLSVRPAAAQDVCRTEGRATVDTAHDYESAVRDVVFSCTKDARPCSEAKINAQAALQALMAAHERLLARCDNSGEQPPPGTSRGVLLLNEVDYDQPGADTLEFVEIYNAGTDTADLDGIALVLVNGANNAEYLRINLNGLLQPEQFAVVSSVNVAVATEALAFSLPANDSVQNGAPDGIALVDTVTLDVLDVLSYEGAITAANIIGFSDPVSLVEGTPLAIDDPGSGTDSLIRLPDGADTSDQATDWHATTHPTPGAANSL